jgi:MFS family permease
MPEQAGSLLGKFEFTEAEHARHLRRAIVASTVGTTIEWYDFFLYSFASGLVFAKLYFPKSDPLMGTIDAFAVYAVGFIARPVGAAIFGHYGDRIGRKSTLIATLMLMGLATFAVALVPGYATIGVWGAVALVVLRFIQGVGVGGEWGGSVLLAMEWTRTNTHRGFAAAWPQFGVPAGLFLANLAVLVFSTIAGPAFATWGWRIPFLLSIVLVAIGMWIRLGILETPVFRRLVEQEELEQAPMLEVWRRQPKEIILSALCRMGEQAPFYIFTAFVYAYVTGALHLPRNLVLVSVLSAAVVSLFTIPIAGHLSDRFGRRRVYMIGAAMTAVYGFAYFAMLNTAIPFLVFLGIVLSLVPHDTMYGPQAALIAESFTPRLRYSGASIGYQLASIIAGGPAPLIATALFAGWHSGYVVAAFIFFCGVVSLLATMGLQEYAGRDISAEYDRQALATQPGPAAAQRAT